MKDFIAAFRALRGAPRALWLVILAFMFDAISYFAIVPLMKPFLGQDIGIKPAWASVWVSLFTGAVTIFMLVVGKPAERRLGTRKSILLALAIALGGRIIYASAPFLAGAVQVAVSLAVVALAEAIIQPVCYSGVKRYTSAETGSMGFALLYAGFNLGAMLSGPISSSVRTTFDVAYKAGTSKLSGFNAVNWTCVGITALALVVLVLTLTKSVESKAVRDDVVVDEASSGGKPPYRDPRFLFFIFALLPVRTLFAHQYLTMPEYVLRAYPEAIADKMEWLVNSINPLIILLGVPTITAMTKRFHVLTMMTVGSLVSAASTFMLVPGESGAALIAYFVVFSIGEALWASRFYEYTAELAPPGRVAQYMGYASVPWFLAKMTTGLYSGAMLEHFVPKSGPKSPGPMWLIYALIAMMSPVTLFLARKWIRSGMKAGA